MRLRIFLPILLSFAFSWQSSVPEIPAIDLNQLHPDTRSVITPYLEEARQNESDDEARGQLGMVLQAFELYREAAACYRAARVIAPDDYRWPYLLAVVEARLGDTQKAIEELRRTLNIRPDFDPARVRLAETLLAANQLEESLRLFTTLLEKQPDSPIVRYGRGRVLLETGRSDEAVEDLEEAVELYTEFGSAHYSLALAYRDLGRRDDAARQMDLYQQYGNQWPPSKDELMAQVQQMKSTPKDLISLGVSLAEKKQYEEAIEVHLKAVEKEPDLAQGHANLLQLYARIGDLEKAIEHYRRAVEVSPDFYESHYNYGVVMLQEGNRAEARRAFEEVVRINPYHADAYNNLGILQMLAGELESASQSFRQALANDPRHTAARFNLGRVLVALDQLEEAGNQFELLTREKNDEELPRYLYALAATRIRMGELKEGLRLANRAHAEALERGQTELAEQIAEDTRRLEGNSDSGH